MIKVAPPSAYSDPAVLRLRDEIAAATLQTFLRETELFQAVVSSDNPAPPMNPADVADICYGLAEAMIARRFQGP